MPRRPSGSRPPARNDVSDEAEVRALEACWTRLSAAHHGHLDAEYKTLVKKWRPLQSVDPISLPVDLLSPMGSAWHEPSHTQVLGYLLDPGGEHGLGSRPLELLYWAVVDAMGEDPRAESLEAASGNLSDAAVVAERASILLSGSEETRPRTDLWIEAPAEEPRLLVVIENKIHDVARPGQLAAYDEAIRRRLERLKTPPLVVKVYLTPAGVAPPADAGGGDWVPLSFGLFALHWTRLVDGDATAGRTFLRLYLATVFQKVLGVRFAEKLPREVRAELAAYLRVRLDYAE